MTRATPTLCHLRRPAQVRGAIAGRDACHRTTAGLTLPCSSGAVEGNVNRIKMLKRQMYGRACFGLLRKRVIFHPG
jgi:hypothetical protein